MIKKDLVLNKIPRGGAVRNQRAKIAKCDYVAFLDSYDEWLPNHLENKIRLIKETATEAVFGNFILAKGGNVSEIVFKADYRMKENIGYLILGILHFDARTFTFIFKRDAFLKVKFDENLKSIRIGIWQLTLTTNLNGLKMINLPNLDNPKEVL